MAKVLINETNLTNIAEAIRGKTGETAKMKPAEMAGKINGIQTGGGEDAFSKFLESANPGPLTINAETIREGAFCFSYDYASIPTYDFICPNLKTVGKSAFRPGAMRGTPVFNKFIAPKLETVGPYSFYNALFKKYDFSSLKTIGEYAFGGYDNYNFSSDNIFIGEKVESIGDNAFENRPIKKAVIGEKTTNPTTFGGTCFSNSQLETLICNNVSTFYTMAFWKSKLSTLVIKGATVPQLTSTSVFGNTPIADGTGSIYVPDALVEQYKVATNWAIYADQIKPLSEYTEA